MKLRSNKSSLKPLNKKQRDYINAINHNDCVIAIGSAGTSKTYIPSVMAAEALLNKQTKKVVIVRPAEGPCKGLGFEPGSLQEKLENWVRPVSENMIKVLGETHYRYLLKVGTIELLPLHQVKGRSFDDCWIILDEVEDIDKPTVKSLLTRLGVRSKLILAGDIKQKSIKGDSGLSYVVHCVKKYNLGIPLIEFTLEDCIRSDFCKMWLEVFEYEV